MFCYVMTVTVAAQQPTGQWELPTTMSTKGFAQPHGSPSSSFLPRWSLSSSFFSHPFFASLTPVRDLQAWDYSFETENGIKQEARGEMKRVDDVDVIVMRGSYSYIGAGEEEETQKSHNCNCGGLSNLLTQEVIDIVVNAFVGWEQHLESEPNF